MSDIRELLAAEAQRLQPAQAPEFPRLLAARARRRYGAIAGAAVLIAAIAGGTSLMAQDNRPLDQPGIVRQPAAGGAPTAGVPVSGILQQIGGPVGIGPRKIAGTVHFQSAAGVLTSTKVTADGRFSLTVPPGRYQATGTPIGSDRAICEADSDVVVPAAGLTGVQVNCHVR
jgi:hypothetical protein